MNEDEDLFEEIKLHKIDYYFQGVFILSVKYSYQYTIAMNYYSLIFTFVILFCVSLLGNYNFIS